MATRYTRADIKFHGVGNGYTVTPAVNVKIHGYQLDTPALYASVAAANGGAGTAEAAGFTRAWVESHLTEDRRQLWWDAALEQGWEQLEEDVNAEEIFEREVAIRSEGRSGGWAIVCQPAEKAGGYCRPIWTDRAEVLAWDAIAVARWGKFARFCAETVADVPYQYLSLIYMNVYEAWYQDQTDNAPARAIVAAALKQLAAERDPASVCDRGAAVVLQHAIGHLTGEGAGE